MDDIIVTVFTPTYNRAYILEKLYESLINQTSFAFEWMIVDDGSTDNTEKNGLIRLSNYLIIRKKMVVNIEQ